MSDIRKEAPGATDQREKDGVEFAESKDLPEETRQLILQMRDEFRQTFNTSVLFPPDTIEDEVFSAYAEVAIAAQLCKPINPEEEQLMLRVKECLPKEMQTYGKDGGLIKLSFPKK